MEGALTMHHIHVYPVDKRGISVGGVATLVLSLFVQMAAFAPLVVFVDISS